MIGVSYAAAVVVENRSAAAVNAGLQGAGIDWARASADGLRLRVTGTAPDEVARFRAINVAAGIVGPSRVNETIEVTPPEAIEAPRFSVEMLRNDDGLQLIGLIPDEEDDAGMGTAALAAAAVGLAPGENPVSMLQKAAWPAPAGWDAAIHFGMRALALLRRSKISVTAGEVRVIAIAASVDERDRLEAQLLAEKPDGVTLDLDISAPRPVITPFALHLVLDEAGAHVDTCSAAEDADAERILAALRKAGARDATCTVGLGSPTRQWADGVIAAITAVADLGAGSVTLADTDVTLHADTETSRDEFERVAGDLRAALPAAFSLDAVPPASVAEDDGQKEFTALLDENGIVALRGGLADMHQKAAVDAFARAAFGVQATSSGTRLDPDLPDGWPLRVLAGLESLSHLHQGELHVGTGRITLAGVTGEPDARTVIAAILASRLGPDQDFRIDVRYDKELDPDAPPPTPAECAADIRALMAREQITFNPGSAEIAPEAEELVDALATSLRKCPPLTLEIGGHTDSQGSDKTNSAISQARADAVMMALLGRGVDTSRMTARGYGSEQPVADNATRTGREANRRIEFRFLDPGADPDEDEAPDEATGAEDESPAAPKDAAPEKETADAESGETADDETAPAPPADMPATRPRHRKDGG